MILWKINEDCQSLSHSVWTRAGKLLTLVHRTLIFLINLARIATIIWSHFIYLKFSPGIILLILQEINIPCKPSFLPDHRAPPLSSHEPNRKKALAVLHSCAWTKSLCGWILAITMPYPMYHSTTSLPLLFPVMIRLSLQLESSCDISLWVLVIHMLSAWFCFKQPERTDLNNPLTTSFSLVPVQYWESFLALFHSLELPLYTFTPDYYILKCSETLIA